MLKDLLFFLNHITFIDYVFFFTVVFLIILVVSLIYFIRINEDEYEEISILESSETNDVIEDAIKKEIKTEINKNTYEAVQEEKAIISYEELLSNTGEFKLNYESETNVDGLSVKKFDLGNLIDTATKNESTKIEVHLIPLKHEEEFLNSLKEFQKLLN